MKIKFFYSTDFDIESLEGFHLLQDHVGTHYRAPWDDFDYIVTFQVHRSHNRQRQSFGEIKVLVNGYQDTSKYFIEHGTPDGKSIDITDLLKPDKVVSLASDIDYYQRLRKALSDDALTYLDGICDASYNYVQFPQYSTWPGFSGSLFRDGTAARAILKKGKQIALGRYIPEKKFDITVDDLPQTFDPVTFNFDNERALGRTNINLVIGKNGVGKTTILRRIVDHIAGLAANGQSWPYFHKVIVAAHSPFEDFDTKNALIDRLREHYALPDTVAPSQKDRHERQQLYVNEYSYIGFKNDDNAFSLSWPKEHSAKSLVKIMEYDNDNLWWTEDSRFDRLFDTLRLSIDFDCLSLSTCDGGKLEFRKEESASRKTIRERKTSIDFEKGITFNKDGRALSLSSGQRVYSYLLPCLVAEIDEESLLIIDEPELYLHPTMEIGLINMVKYLLTKTTSNAIIATHSSVMAREVERDGITLLRHVDGRTQSSRPGFETFGAPIDLIIGEAFDDYRIKKPYEETLDRVVTSYGSAEHAILAIGQQIGDDALAYITAKFEDDSKVTFEEPE
ncbi:ATP-binding protein [Burkholderia anthina]|uniref:AAA family ATPase n=1 Tax=Burkholderia anthina TaxID=179879 RepID=UPI000F5F2ABB|nr:AAA family ATPase [Burkholderia anthina]RQX84576.1 ATP-binding protein [Burkholderia anthina]